MFNVTPPDDLPLSEEEYHLLLIITLLGDLPLDFLKKGEWSDSFFDLKTGSSPWLFIARIYLKSLVTGKPLGMDISEDANSTLAEIVEHWAPESLAEDERVGLVDLLSRMIRILPQDRETAQELLEHPWLQCSDQPHIPPPPPFDISRPISPPPHKRNSATPPRRTLRHIPRARLHRSNLHHQPARMSVPTLEILHSPRDKTSRRRPRRTFY